MTFDVKGMTCAACSAHVEKSVRRLDGVREVRVNLLSNSMEVDFDTNLVSAEAICAAVATGGYSAAPRGVRNNPRSTAAEKSNAEARETLRRLLISACLLVPVMLLGMGPMMGLPLPKALRYPLVNGLVQMLIATPVLILNKFYFTNGFKALFHGAPNMNSLISVGATAGYLYSVGNLLFLAFSLSEGRTVGMTTFYFESAAMIVTLISIGKYLEARAKGRTSEAITGLMNLAPKRAFVIRDGVEQEVEASALIPGDLVIVREGQTVPADGVIVEGSGALDQSMLTGESLPVELSVGDSVTGATLNTSGSFRFRVTKVGEDTALSKIIRLVEAAANSKAPISRLADRVSGVFVPIVIAIALVTFGAWLALGAGVAVSLKRAIAVLVISCPCSLGLATPTAIMVGTGKGADLGIMIKSAASLEMGHTIDCVAFDKTGTLTKGEMQVVAVKAYDGELLSMATSVEQLSAHPIAKAIVRFASMKGARMLPATAYKTAVGKGVSATIGEQTVYVGSGEWLESLKISTQVCLEWAEEKREEGATVLFAATDKKLLGAFALADGLRARSVSAIAALNALNVKTVMLTGDNERTAQAIGQKIGIREVRAHLLPEDKERALQDLQASGNRVMMIGDGINDAPALTRAELGVAIGGGTDVAIESADVVLMREDPYLVVDLIRLSRATIRNIRQNLFWAFFYNAIGIPLAAGVLAPLGIEIDPMFAAAAMSVSSFCVVTNALRLRGFRSDAPASEEEFRSETAVEYTTETIQKGEEKMKKVYIEGMMCMHCVAHVRKALSPLDVNVEVNLQEKCATLKDSVSDDAIRAAVTEAGYEVVGIE